MLFFFLDFTTKDQTGIYEIENKNFILLAILAFKDKVRKNVKNSIAKCKQGGVRVRMLTGDNKNTALSIAKEVGIYDEENSKSLVLEGTEFNALTGRYLCCNYNKIVIF